MTKLGFQIPNFTLPGVADEKLFGCVAEMATRAEAAGFDTLLVMDHFYQLPALGPPSNAMLESYTLLGALAARTSRIRPRLTRRCSRRGTARPNRRLVESGIELGWLGDRRRPVPRPP